MTAIIFEGVGTDYGKDLHYALGSLDFTIQGGECIFVSGPNGGGKTTLARLLAGTVQAVRGKIMLADGSERGEWPPTLVGWVQQEPEHQVIAERVGEDVGISPSWYAGSYQEYQNAKDGALAALGLTAMSQRGVQSLSGGELHRTAMAAIVAQRPEVWVMDEPEAMMDRAGQAALWEVVGQLKQKHATVVMISHDARWLPVADRCLWIGGGQALWLGHEDMAARLADPWHEFWEIMESQVPGAGGRDKSPGEVARMLWP